MADGGFRVRPDFVEAMAAFGPDLHVRIALACSQCHNETFRLTTHVTHHFLAYTEHPSTFLKAEIMEKFQAAGAEYMEAPCEHIAELVAALFKEE